MVADVVDVAWQAIGRPQVDAPSDSGRCARCGQEAPLVATSQAVSKHYRGWDGWVDPCGSGVCLGCLWSFRTPLLRSVAHWIHRDPHMLVAVSPEELTARLSQGLGGSDALLLPLQPGRRHLIQLAQWGTITTDDGPLQWTGEDARRLVAYHRLRCLGFRHSQLAAATPVWQALLGLSNEQVAQVLRWWPELDAWRANPAWLRVAAHTVAPVSEVLR